MINKNKSFLLSNENVIIKIIDFYSPYPCDIREDNLFQSL